MDVETPEAEEWAWTPRDLACEACGKTNVVPEQPPEELARGVLWECSHCRHRNLEKTAAAFPEDLFLECGACHSTFSVATPEDRRPTVDADGWTCPVCDTVHKADEETAQAGDGAIA